MKKNRS